MPDLTPTGTNQGLLQIKLLYIYCTEILVWKSTGFVPFGTNLTHFGSKSGHLDVQWCKTRSPLICLASTAQCQSWTFLDSQLKCQFKDTAGTPGGNPGQVWFISSIQDLQHCQVCLNSWPLCKQCCQTALSNVSLFATEVNLYNTWYAPDPPENCHLTVKKLPKTWHFFQKNCHWQKFGRQRKGLG